MKLKDFINKNNLEIKTDLEKSQHGLFSSGYRLYSPKGILYLAEFTEENNITIKHILEDLKGILDDEEKIPFEINPEKISKKSWGRRKKNIPIMYYSGNNRRSDYLDFYIDISHINNIEITDKFLFEMNMKFL